jgi:ubiquinone/menaquinone biosynthesis C-methylase UbiE
MTESNVWQVPGSGSEIYENVFVPAMMGEWAPRAIALVNPKAGERVLDVACGTGALTRLVAKTVGPQGRVVGLDLSTDMIAEARRIIIDPSGTAPIEWREGNACALPYKDESFEIVFCEFGLMSIPDRVAALKEMGRVLVPGGRLTASVWGSIQKCPGQLAIRESFERYCGKEEAAIFYRQHVLGDPEAVLSLVDTAGFKEVSVQVVMGMVRLPSPEDLVRSYGAMLEIPADENTQKLIIDEVSQVLQPYVGAEGLAYPIEAILASAVKLNPWML